MKTITVARRRQEQGQEGSTARGYAQRQQILGRQNCARCLDLLPMGGYGHRSARRNGKKTAGNLDICGERLDLSLLIWNRLFLSFYLP